MDYLYDESFEGFLTCVWMHYRREAADGIYPAGLYQQDLLRPARAVATDEEKADRVYRAITEKISSYDAERIYRAFRTTVEDKEMKLLRYIRLGFKRGPQIRLLHGNAVVTAVEDAEYKLGGEVHRLCGLIRFSAVADGVLFAEISPDHDVLEFLARHFTDRFKEEPFLIWDEKREKALVAYRRRWYVEQLPRETVRKDPAFQPSGAEHDYRRLWRRYFDTIAIKERTNPKCQKNFMPVRYWKNLTEMQRF